MRPNRLIKPFIFLVVLACCTTWPSGLLLATPWEQAPRNGKVSDALIRGERIYREGILPSGKPLRVTVTAPGTAYACAGCHMRSGMGAIDENVYTPPIHGPSLFRPTRKPHRGIEVRSNEPPFLRPAYNDTTVAAAIRDGVSSSGTPLSDAMPRFILSDGDMALLTAYLRQLSTTPSPGASDGEFRFATIITDDVSQEDRQALLLFLKSFIGQRNQQKNLYNDFLKFGYSPTIDMKHAFRRASLDVWELKGAPHGWNGQLAAYYDRKPVFAVLGGISNGEWNPIHRFCESRRLPCLFPFTNYPVTSGAGWYTFYFNRGYIQEGEAVARYLNRRFPDAGSLPPVLQIVQDSPAGRALAAGFRDQWSILDRPAAPSLILTKKQLLDRDKLPRLLARHKPGILILWTDADLLPRLPEFAAQLAAPGIAFVSSGYLGQKTASIAESVRDRIHITYPYRLTPYVGAQSGAYDAKIPIKAESRDLGDHRIASRSATVLSQVIPRALNLLDGNLFRDRLLEVIELQMDLVVRDYERFSFGPGQRHVSQGCYIMQLGPGPTPSLLPRSEWIIP